VTLNNFKLLKGVFMKKEIQKKQDQQLVPDLIQTTLLIDCSGSMNSIWLATVDALSKLQKEIDCGLLSIQFFNDSWKLAKDFDQDNDGQIAYPDGWTNMYGAIIKSIRHSREVAGLTPEFKAHHVFVVITDGLSNEHTDDEIVQCKKEVASMDVEATFFLLNSSNEDVGQELGWLSTPFKNTPKSITDAINKVKATVNQINDNVANKLPPTSGNLLLPPAKGVH
jgi:hypothetical protein